MTAEQLKAARAAHWRQDQKPILTLEEAESWFRQHPLTPFSPRRAQLPAPAPSFVEACLGEANATPPIPAIEQATKLLGRLTASGAVVALNLFGTVGEQPDFVVHTEALPFVISLRGERNWKQAPATLGGHKVSPLVVGLWTLLEQAGPLTAAEIRERLGRELTEAAVLRALSALWQPLRVVPVLQSGGQPARWELLQTRHRQAVIEGSSNSQVTAISLLVSMYLQSVFAATGDEIEIFLSPLVSRSRIREALRGLVATKQIHSLSMDANTYYFLEEGLAQFTTEPEQIEPPRGPRIRPTRDPEKSMSTRRFPTPLFPGLPAPGVAAPGLPAFGAAQAGTASPSGFRNPQSGRPAAPGSSSSVGGDKRKGPSTRPAGSLGAKGSWQGKPGPGRTGSSQKPPRFAGRPLPQEGGRVSASGREERPNRPFSKAPRPGDRGRPAFPNRERNRESGPPAARREGRPSRPFSKSPRPGDRSRPAFPSRERNRSGAEGFPPRRESAPGREARSSGPGFSPPKRRFSSSGGRGQMGQAGGWRSGPAAGAGEIKPRGRSQESQGKWAGKPSERTPREEYRGSQTNRPQTSGGLRTGGSGTFRPKTYGAGAFRKPGAQGSGRKPEWKNPADPQKSAPGEAAGKFLKFRPTGTKSRSGFKGGASKPWNSGARSSRPKSGGASRAGKGGFRGRNLGKKNPEA